MSSNYNRRPLPAEVLVDGGHAKLIRRSQNIDDQLRSKLDSDRFRSRLQIADSAD